MMQITFTVSIATSTMTSAMPSWSITRSTIIAVTTTRLCDARLSSRHVNGTFEPFGDWGETWRPWPTRSAVCGHGPTCATTRGNLGSIESRRRSSLCDGPCSGLNGDRSTTRGQALKGSSCRRPPWSNAAIILPEEVAFLGCEPFGRAVGRKLVPMPCKHSTDRWQNAG